MNDFTLEELKSLLSCVNGEIRHNIDAESLKLKLKSLIAAYCTHSWRQGQHLFHDVFCPKCHKSFEVYSNVPFEMPD